MKKKWEEPRILVQQFAPNEYVSACVTGTIQCMYPGNGQSNGQAIYDDYNGDSTGNYEDGEGLLHGICGYETPVSFNGNTASGYESINGVVQMDRFIYNIQGYDQRPGTYDVIWTSKHTSTGTPYHHKGRLTITSIDSDRPNHS